MKKIILILVFISAFSCKNKKEDSSIEETKVERKIVLNEVARPDLSTWGKVNIIFENVEENTESKLMYRKEDYEQSAFVITRKIPVTYNKEYKMSIRIKKGIDGDFFGLRILGEYPDRVDAVFDLHKGVLVGVQKTRDFEDPIAEIQDLGDGWYSCSVSARVIADEVSLIFGPTSKDRPVVSWEAKTESNCNVFVATSSLKLEEITYQ